jgi:hypothetical protein
MDWTWVGTALGALAAGLAEYKRRRERALRREAEKNAADLQRILDEAHKLGNLAEQARVARERAQGGQ